jgi:hypothetical protein
MHRQRSTLHAPRSTLGYLLLAIGWLSVGGVGTAKADTAEPADAASQSVDDAMPVKVNAAATTAAGIRKLTGQHLTLYTDLPPGEEIDRLPEIFDQAVPQWCQYFHIDPATCTDWRMTGFLMHDKERFQRAALLPDNLPAFLHGYSWNYALWLYDQPSDYYRRHLLLHEGTHGFMNTRLGGCGPPWYMEGLAELLGTHRWQDGRLTLNYMPANREEVPEWGRVRIIKDAMADHRGKRLKTVIEFPPTAFLETSTYAWSWASAVLLDRHPRYQSRFHSLYKHVLDGDISARFYRLFQPDWQELSEEWQLFVSGMEYGYDIARTAVDFTPGKALTSSRANVTVAADRGWQNSGLRLEGGAKYALRAAGRYQVGQQPQPWWCEPGGVSIRYYQGRPLGILLAAVRGDHPEKDSLSALLRPVVVGLGRELTVDHSGTLFFKINHSAAELENNVGELKVEIEQK